MNLLDTTAAVVTPERVPFRHRLAGPGRRAMAWTIDASFRALIALFILIIVLLLSGNATFQGIGTGTLLLTAFFLEWGYGVFFETVFRGKTPGKAILSLRVVRLDGSPAGFSDILLRNLLRAVDYLPGFFAIGVLAMAADRRLRRVGDMVGGTVVVVEDRSTVRGQVLIDPPVTEAERQALPAAVVLTRDELTVIEAYLRRRPRLSSERAEELAWLFGPALSERTGVTSESWERVLTLAYARATGQDR